MAEEAGGSTAETRTDDMHWGFAPASRHARHARPRLGLHDTRDIRQELTDRKSEVRTLVDNRFYWTIGIILTLFTIHSGLMVGLLKL